MFATVKSALSGRLTYANVASTMALVLALGSGTAYAANTIGSTDIINGQVKAVDIGANAVNSAKIAAGAVTTDDIADNSLGDVDVLDESLTSSDLGIDSVQASEIADGSIDGGEVTDNSLFASDLASSSVGTSEISDGSVFGTDIASSTITGTDIASSTITGADVASNTLTLADIFGTDNNGAVSYTTGVPNGRCSQSTLSIPGAAVGQVPAIAVLGPIQNGVFLYASTVPAANQVMVNLCNFSGTSFNPISNLGVRVITFG